jgi:hypothetical protein
MKYTSVKQLLQVNQKALFTAKGHHRKTIKTVISMLQQMPLDYEIKEHKNPITPTNAGVVAEVFAGYLMGYDKHELSPAGQTDLPKPTMNEIKLCYANNKPSNTIEDKGHYMVDMLTGKARLTWVNRDIVRECKDYLIKGGRGGNTYAQAVMIQSPKII